MKATLSFVVLFLVANSQHPPTSVTSVSLGNCERFDLNLLGDWSGQSTHGLIPQQLIYEAQNTYTQYFTEDLPDVQIFEANRTCESFGNSINKSTSVSVVVHYFCYGLACLQDNNVTVGVNYTHHFSFKCDVDTSTYSLWRGEYTPYTRRIITNYSISDAVVTKLGQCAICVISDIFLVSLRYNDYAGCLGNLISQLTIILTTIRTLNCVPYRALRGETDS